jgi:tripeptidyl-peptidase-1
MTGSKLSVDEPRLTSLLHEMSKSHHEIQSVPSIVERASLGLRDDISKKSRANPESLHIVVLAVKQLNMEKLELALNEVADPKSPSYGAHWTKLEITAMTSNPAANDEISSYLNKNGCVIVSTTSSGEYVTAEASIQQWEKLFSTDFFEYSVASNEAGGTATTVLRATEYTLPRELGGHVTYIFNVANFPQRVPTQIVKFYQHDDIEATASTKTSKKAATPTKKPTEIINNAVYLNNEMTVAQINAVYNVTSNTGWSGTSQAVYESIGQTYSPSDLTDFQNYFKLPVEAVAVDIGGHSNDNACKGNDCAEANLDVQYMMGVAQNIPTTYYYSEDWMVNFLTEVADMSSPPLVISISYSSYESEFWPDMPGYFPAFDTQAIKLGLMGVTLLSASGDDGSNQGENTVLYLSSLTSNQ